MMKKILFLIDAPIGSFDPLKDHPISFVFFSRFFAFIRMILFSSSYEPVIASPGGAFLFLKTHFDVFFDEEKENLSD